MKAIRFHANIPRYLFTKAFGKVTKLAYISGFPPTKLDDVPEPKSQFNWVKVKTILTGICGSDINTIQLKESPLLEPICSFPSVLGHETVGIINEIDEVKKNLSQGDRVVVDPILSCKVREIDPICDHCKKGNTVRCDNFDRGNISPGFDLGWCRDTGGAFSPYFLSHINQLHKVPNSVSNENAVLVEPFSIALHAVMRHFPKNEDTVLVVGSGVIGLMVISALRILGSKAKIIALDKVNNSSLAIDYCRADEFIQVGKKYYKNLVKQFGGRMYKPLLENKDLVVGGGADVVYECVGLASTIEDALRFCKAGGRMVLIGNPEKINVDWSLIWFREIQILGSFGSCDETSDNGIKIHAFDIVLDLMKTGKLDLSWMVTHKFRFPTEYKKALKISMNKRRYNVIKSVFSFSGS